MILAQVFLAACALACALGFAYWYKRANTIEPPPDDDLPFQGRMDLLVYGYIVIMILAIIFGGIGLVAAIAVATIVTLIVRAAVSKLLRQDAPGPKKVLPLWLGIPMSGIWGFVPESWRCRHR